MKRGSGMGNQKTLPYWERVQALAQRTCTQAAEQWERWRGEGAGAPRAASGAPAV